MTRIAPAKAFKILGVTPRDDFATIRQAWIRLVKENHPDVATGDPKVLTARLTDLNEAYDALCWHSPAKVRIRQERQAEQERLTRTAHHKPAPRNTATAPSPKTTDRVRQTASVVHAPYMPRKSDRRTAEDRRDNGAKEPATARRHTSSGGLSAADRFRAVQTLCSSDALARAAQSRRCV